MARTSPIAEVGSTHDGSLGNALQLIDAAADCGADGRIVDALMTCPVQVQQRITY